MIITVSFITLLVIWCNIEPATFRFVDCIHKPVVAESVYKYSTELRKYERTFHINFNM
jgi:hypothetical protein